MISVSSARSCGSDDGAANEAMGQGHDQQELVLEQRPQHRPTIAHWIAHDRGIDPPLDQRAQRPRQRRFGVGMNVDIGVPQPEFLQQSRRSDNR